jgi:signal transduction histidine kinase/ligand-binding sensor domain-containing protein
MPLNPGRRLGIGAFLRLFWASVLLTGFGLAWMAEAGEAVPGVSPDPGYIVRSWETADGLPENSATAITQTPDGYLWFGTFNGLVRFNGVEFKVFNQANTPELPSAGIVNLHTDKAGRLLVSTYRGLVVREGAEWRQLSRTDGSDGECVRSFANRSNGDTLITTFNGKVLELSGRHLAELPSPPGEPGRGYIGGVDEDGHWWVVQSKFVGRWEKDRWVRRISTDGPVDPFACAPAHDGGMWLLLGDRLIKLRHGREVSHRTQQVLEDGAWSLTEDSQENLWIASDSRGFVRVTPKGEVTTWKRADGWSDSGRSVFEDREGDLWLGTSGNGLFRVTQQRFVCFGLVDGAKGIAVSSVSTDGAGGLWAATLGKWLFHMTPTGVTNSAKPGADNHSPYVQSVLSDRAGRLWIGAWSDPLRLVDQKGARQVAPTESGNGNVTALFEDARGRVWMGNDVGVATSDGTAITTFKLGDELPKRAFGSLAEDASGALWAASPEGVFRRESEQSFVEVKNRDGQSIKGTSALRADRDGSVWLASADRGLSRWRNGQLIRLDLAPGFPVNAGRSIVEDNAGHFWMTAEHSVLRIRIADLHALADGEMSRLKYQLFDTSDGLPRAEFPTGRQPASVRDALGRLWFATSKGVAMIDPAALRLNDVPPPVQVEEVSFYRPGSAPTNTSGGQASIREVQVRVTAPFAGPVALPPGSRRIEIRYAGLSFTAPEKVRYQVKLDGLDADWRDDEGEHVEEFQDLAPRDYVFHVRAANNDGVWNETGATLAFTVLPYYWQTTWFRILTSLLLIGFGALAAWIQSRKHVRRALERERVSNQMRALAGRLITAQEQERTRLARELHDDISQRLARLAIDVGKATQTPSQSLPAETRHEVLSGLVQLSEDVHALSYRLHPSIIEELGLAEALKAETERVQRQDGLTVKLKLGELPPTIPAPISLCLFRVGQEALRNAVRHARSHAVQVSLRAVGKGIELAVQDDGCGFDATAPGDRPSLGLASMHERVLSLGGELDVESAPGQGTTILAWVPLQEGNA